MATVPSQKHELLVSLFRRRPALAPELLRGALGVALPSFTEVRLDSEDLTQVRPTEYRADLVLRLLVPVCLLVVAANERTARWASRRVEIGGGNTFAPLVLGPSGVPAVVDEDAACADPELAVISAIAHGKDPDSAKAARVALAAQVACHGLDDERSPMYFDLVLSSLSKAARKELRAMDPAKYKYQSDFAKRYVAQGRAEGMAEGKAEGEAEGELRGRAALLIRQLTRRFGELPPWAAARLSAATIDELDEIGERLLSAVSIEEVLGVPDRSHRNP